jgi:DNA-binding NarL/FixJ family response regulator
MTEPPPRTRIALVEDNPVLRDNFAELLSAVDDFELVSQAGTLAEGMALLDRPFDLLLVDLGLPDGSGISLIETVRARFGDTVKVLVISIFGDVQNVVRAIEVGADGYLLKSADMAAAERAIREVLAGGAPISAAVAGHILARVRGTAQPVPAEGEKPRLTPREIAVLTDLAKGFTYKEVARLHQISPHTVGDHVKAIYRKLAVTSRSEAVFEAVQTGLIKLAD